MKIQEKLDHIQAHHFGRWLKVRGEVLDDLSSKQSLFCVCGRLATGFHESSCRKFNDLATKKTVKILEDEGLLESNQ